MPTINYKNVLLLLGLVIPLINLLGQSPIVKRINFIGYEKTKLYILEREIQHPIDVPLDAALAEADRLRLENLGIFSMVNMQIISVGQNEVNVRYTVIENWRFFPMLSPLYDEKWGWSVGATLMINNFRGRNESLVVRGQYGGQNTFGVEYYNPWVTGDHVSIKISAGNDVYDHTFLPYDVTYNHFQIRFGKYINNRLRTKAGLFLSEKTYSNETEKRGYFHITPYSTITFDSRDLYVSPSKGIYSTNTLYVRFDTKGEALNQLLWSHSTNKYHELIDGKWKTVLGLNIDSRFTFGKNLDIWYDYIGGAYSVRGWKVPNNKLYESTEQSYRFGMNWVTSSVEIRQTVVPKFATKLGNELGLSVITFADIGFIDNNISNLFQNTPILGTGVGIRVPWSVIGSIRLDYGWSFYKGNYVGQALHLAFGEKF